MISDENLDIYSIPVYASEKRWDEINFLIDNNFLKDVSNIDISILLCELAYYDQLDVIEKLINLGANVNYRFEEESSSLFQYQINAYPRTTPLGQTIMGASYGRNKTAEITSLLLSSNSNPNLHTYSGYTPLQLAIVENTQENASVLLSNGADPNILSNDIEPMNAYDIAEQEESAWARKLLSR